MSAVAISSRGIDDDELLAPTFLLVDVLFAEFIEELHDAGHCLRVRTLPFRGKQTRLFARESMTSPAGAFSV